jgi:hypothetical protein
VREHLTSTTRLNGTIFNLFDALASVAVPMLATLLGDFDRASWLDGTVLLVRLVVLFC